MLIASRRVVSGSIDHYPYDPGNKSILKLRWAHDNPPGMLSQRLPVICEHSHGASAIQSPKNCV
jgi:hypothetical protein